MSNEKVTISIVSYNNFKDVKKAVDSIERLTDPSLKKHIYIIDNANEEALYKTLNYEDVEYIRSPRNIGFGAGHNKIVSELNSAIHIVMNPDIVLVEDSISKLYEFMKDPDIGMCIPRLVDDRGNSLDVYRREVTIFDMFIRMFAKGMFKKRQAYHSLQDQDYSKVFPVPFAQGSFLVIKTQLLQSLGGFDERFFMYMEDADLCKRVNEVSQLVYFPGTTIIHKWEKGSHKNYKLFKIHVRSMISYFNKWGWAWK
ncbi:MAG: glycosyltransferase family 2 protein [Firmicutes bacterium]|nr:glycosyltransferase family 2 protein [Bacillota bacterium]